MFIDEARVEVKAGDGGRGVVSFRREKFVPRGGPDGGNGGTGGSIRLVARGNQNTLVAFRFRPLFKAERGRHGEGARKTGRDGEDLELAVPLGTVVYDDETGELLGDLVEEGARFLVAQGGRGGRGNACFTSSTNQAPRRSDDGAPGEERRLRLELRLLADVGLVGLPNAGKSTLLRRVSSAKPKVADYPFTTLNPHLGVVGESDWEFVIADVPGLIEGAHQGQGLGHQFLRHLLRTRFLVFLIDVSETSESDPVEDFRVLRQEVVRYGQGLEKLPAGVAANKLDILMDDQRAHALEEEARAEGLDTWQISAATGQGTKSMIRDLARRLQEERAARTPVEKNL